MPVTGKGKSGGMVDTLLTVAGALALVVAALSALIQRLPLSWPLLALLIGIVFGPAVLGVIDLPTVVGGHKELHEVSRILLAVSVMAVALRYPIRAVRSRIRPVAVLLGVAMLGMALLTTAVSAAALGIGFGAAALLGAALTPTGPVLASQRGHRRTRREGHYSPDQAAPLPRIRCQRRAGTTPGARRRCHRRAPHRRRGTAGILVAGSGRCRLRGRSGMAGRKGAARRRGTPHHRVRPPVHLHDPSGVQARAEDAFQAGVELGEQADRTPCARWN
jgi:hypothetical protein